MESTTDHRRRMPDGPRGDLQYALFRVLRSLVFRGDPASPMNELPLSQLKCLHVVGDSEGPKMIDIAHRMEIGLPAVSQIVDRLVRKGLVQRHPDPQDRRVVRIALTEKAKTLMSEAGQHRQRRMDATMDYLDQDEIEGVTDGLARLAEAAERVEARERIEHPFRDGSDHSNGHSSGVNSDPLVELIAERERSRKQRTLQELLPTDVSDRP